LSCSCFIQAFIFALLSALYLSESLEDIIRKQEKHICSQQKLQHSPTDQSERSRTLGRLGRLALAHWAARLALAGIFSKAIESAARQPKPCAGPALDVHRLCVGRSAGALRVVIAILLLFVVK